MVSGLKFPFKSVLGDVASTALRHLSSFCEIKQ